MDRAEMESVSWKLPWKGSRRTLRHEQEDESLSPQCQHFSRTSRRGQESGERIMNKSQQCSERKETNGQLGLNEG